MPVPKPWSDLSHEEICAAIRRACDASENVVNIAERLCALGCTDVISVASSGFGCNRVLTVTLHAHNRAADIVVMR